ALGDKAEAKAIAERAGVPVLPGYPGTEQTDAAFAKAARDTGYPLMIKPLAGGGGIGMQTVREERALGDALARARRLAASAFGDERLLLERLVERPRHIEVQILADSHGEVQAVGDRDCSLQRRHQKIVDVSPAVAAPHLPRGYAYEARVYAEDPASGFLPSTGRLLHVRWPAGDGIRVDAGYDEGDVVTRHYDPLIAKVIAHGGDPRIALGMLAN